MDDQLFQRGSDHGLDNPCPDSLLVIPADMIDEYVPNARETGADAILFDLEDSVSEEKKPGAREKLADIRKKDLGSKDIYVRPNRIGTEEFESDREILEKVSPDLVVFPKVESAEEVREIEKFLNSGESKTPYKIIIESFRGFENRDEIFSEAETCLLVSLGYEDLSAELGIQRPELDGNNPLNSMLMETLVSAKKHGLQYMDAVSRKFDEEDLDEFREELSYGKEIGCWGKVLIHPNQVPPTKKTYSIEKEIEKAREKIRRFKEADSGVITNEKGEMEDLPSLRQAEEILGTEKDEEN
jgi:citrate lyase subunit beta/citryl-CoA lyase